MTLSLRRCVSAVPGSSKPCSDPIEPLDQGVRQGPTGGISNPAVTNPRPGR